MTNRCDLTSFNSNHLIVCRVHTDNFILQSLFYLPSSNQWSGISVEQTSFLSAEKPTFGDLFQLNYTCIVLFYILSSQVSNNPVCLQYELGVPHKTQPSRWVSGKSRSIHVRGSLTYYWADIERKTIHRERNNIIYPSAQTLATP